MAGTLKETKRRMPQSDVKTNAAETLLPLPGGWQRVRLGDIIPKKITPEAVPQVVYIGLEHIVSKLNQLPIPLPVAEVERRLSVARQLEETVEVNLRRLAGLRQAS
ncbi:MAG: hypothetical protein Kow0063_11070 [Anaerolineae bacterium]